ncbi:beta-ketoacyl synthase [Patiriisocius marinistellae]|uniref:Beta-ketoacyl synthase n=1 Tax=Patiriisocius marinistellae TaxID=2494560 RepID=A0A5J4FVT4_9FLAO|nr:beta-ketoacyl synthase N-terminal-like domain-containing protein [Patiriisocius marinistellae]GEQ85232.1 beta-ketoacyl synthase [Patiriisocius marinistellae]
MNKTYVSHNNIISSLGFNSAAVVEKVASETTGLELVDDKTILPQPFYASVINKSKLNLAFAEISEDQNRYTRLEKMMLLSLADVVKQSKNTISDRTGLIISTTKGNIDVLENNSKFPKSKSYLSELATTVANFFNFKTQPIVVSNACVSGVLAIAIAKRYINEGVFDEVFIVSGDLVTQFILSGFNSFQALSTEMCKPYSDDRTGINIGEVAASILVTKDKNNLSNEACEIAGDSSCNDANHISGPSRTGEGLFRSAKVALKEAGVKASDIDYISAHGTATSFNDEMESIAFERLGMSHIPLNSLKGYFGHTLGASGLLETIVGMYSLNQNKLFTSLGFSVKGTSAPLNIITKNTSTSLNTFLKTASGFGGCNTAVVFKKFNNQ